MKLHQALLANAAFSGTSAVLIALGYAQLRIEIPLPEVYWLLICVGLALFSGQLALMALTLIKQSSWTQAGTSLVLKLTPSVVVADVVWVMGSLILSLIFKDEVSELGFGIISAVNVCVGSLAWLQYRGFKNNKLHLQKQAQPTY